MATAAVLPLSVVTGLEIVGGLTVPKLVQGNDFDPGILDNIKFTKAIGWAGDRPAAGARHATSWHLAMLLEGTATTEPVNIPPKPARRAWLAQVRWTVPNKAQPFSGEYLLASLLARGMRFLPLAKGTDTGKWQLPQPGGRDAFEVRIQRVKDDTTRADQVILEIPGLVEETRLNMAGKLDDGIRHYLNSSHVRNGIAEALRSAERRQSP